MAALFTFASSTYLLNTSGFSPTLPFVIGMWFRTSSDTGNNKTLWSYSDTASTNNYLLLRITATEVVQMAAAAGGAELVNSGGTVFAGAWNFVVARFITAANRKISHIAETGAITSGSSTTTRSAASLDSFTMGAKNDSGGASLFFPGDIAEYWLTSGDVQGDATVAVYDDLLRQLAYGGPFSVPRVVKDIIEYRSFRKHPSSAGDEIGEVYHGSSGRQTWDNINGVTTGHHPPLPYWYEKPGRAPRLLVV